MTDNNINEEVTSDYNYTFKIDINDVFHSFCYGSNGSISDQISINYDIKNNSFDEISVSNVKSYDIKNQINIEREE